MSMSDQDKFVIDQLCAIVSDERGVDMSMDIRYLIKMRLIRMSTARFKVVQTLYHIYKADLGLTAAQSVWRLSDEIGVSDAMIWKIVKCRKL